MSDSDDLYDVTRPQISEESAELLLSGLLPVADGDDLADLGAVLTAARQPAGPAELAGLTAAVAAFRHAGVTSLGTASTARTRPMFRKFLTAKALGTAGIVTPLSAGAAAAAGVVPTPFGPARPSFVASPQDDRDGTDESAPTTLAVEQATTAAAKPPADAGAGAEGVEPTTDADDDDEASDTDVRGPDVSGPAKFGQRTAFAAHDKGDESPASPPASPPTSAEADEPSFAALRAAAAAAGQTVEEFCADATPGRSDDNPSVTAPGRSDGGHGRSDDNPSVTAPGRSGGGHGRSDDNPSVTAPGRSDDGQGRSDDNPSVTAPGRSDDGQGRSDDNPSVTAPGRSDDGQGRSDDNPPVSVPRVEPPTEPEDSGGGHGEPPSHP